jgi:hypothetical protein
MFVFSSSPDKRDHNLVPTQKRWWLLGALNLPPPPLDHYNISKICSLGQLKSTLYVTADDIPPKAGSGSLTVAPILAVQASEFCT